MEASPAFRAEADGAGHGDCRGRPGAGVWRSECRADGRSGRCGAGRRRRSDWRVARVLAGKEIAHAGLTTLELVPTMHERKARMAELADAFLVLPGGYGTLDELMEAVTWAQLGTSRQALHPHQYRRLLGSIAHLSRFHRRRRFPEGGEPPVAAGRFRCFRSSPPCHRPVEAARPFRRFLAVSSSYVCQASLGSSQHRKYRSQEGSSCHAAGREHRRSSPSPRAIWPKPARRRPSWTFPRPTAPMRSCSPIPNIDAIYNPLPNQFHVPWTIKAAEAGKHVLCEKPISLTVAEAKTLLEVRDRTGVKICEAFMIRSFPQWLRLRALLDEGRIGELSLRHRRLQLLQHRPGQHPQPGGVRRRRRLRHRLLSHPRVALRLPPGAQARCRLPSTATRKCTPTG